MNTLPGNMRFGAGQPVRRREDQRLLTGKGQFIDDRPEDGARQREPGISRFPDVQLRIWGSMLRPQMRQLAHRGMTRNYPYAGSF